MCVKTIDKNTRLGTLDVDDYWNPISLSKLLCYAAWSICQCGQYANRSIQINGFFISMGTTSALDVSGIITQ